MTKIGALSEDPILRIAQQIFLGFICGALGGIFAGGIGSLIYWISTKNVYPKIYADVSLSALVPNSVYMYGIPIGLTIGIVTGVHSGIFSNHHPKSSIWVVLSVLGVVAGFWSSGNHPNNFYVFVFEIGFTALGASLLAHRFTMQEHQNDNSKLLKRTFFTSVCSITGMLSIFIIVYRYFHLLHELASIPS